MTPELLGLDDDTLVDLFADAMHDVQDYDTTISDFARAALNRSPADDR